MTRRTIFLIGLLIELVCIFGLFVPYVIFISTGTEITLKTLPVDPRSMFRGDYVILSYEAGNDLPLSVEYGSPVIAVLAKKGDVYERVRYEYEAPHLQAGEVCLRGSAEYMRAEFPDISQYFVEEGLGREFEKAQNAHRLFVNVVVDDDCNAVIKSVRIGEEAPLDSGIPPIDIPVLPVEETGL